MDARIGATLGRYRIEAEIGRGGMATVYRATDPAFQRTVAVKVLDAHLARDSRFRDRFLREAHSNARLQHPHILPVFDVGEQDGTAYLVMQYVDGETFRDRLNVQPARRLALRTTLALLRPVAQALDYAHQQGIIHRDVKPNNILLTRTGYPLLADFGIAKVLEGETIAPLTETGMMVGTPEYMAPEQAQGAPIDGRIDLYALAVILYETQTGRTPFRAETPTDTPISILVRHVTMIPPMPRYLNPAIAPAVEQVLVRALAKRPDERYPTGAALFEALDHAAEAADAADGAPSTSSEESPTAIKPIPVPMAAEIPPPPVATPAAMPALSPVALAAARVTESTPPPGAPAAAPAALVDRRRPARGVYLGLGAVALLLVLAIVGGVLSLVRGGADATPTAAIAASLPVGTPVVAGGATPTSFPLATVPARETAVVPVAATGTTRAVAPASPSAPAAASPARREVILFSSHRGNVHDSQIYVMAPDGTGQRQLTFSRGHSWGPRLSPDGRQFVFSSVAPGEHVDHSATGGGPAGLGNHDIYLANADGSNITKLTRETSWDNAWSWSPDGQWITFASDRDGNWELYRMSREGGQVTRLTNNPAQDGWPSWTADGKQIVFTSDRVGGLSQLHIMNADGSNVRRLHFSESHDTFPFVSPDGTKIVYSAQMLGAREGEIFVMNIDGSGSKRLTSSVALNTEPSWSPDGSKIVFVSDRDGNSNIYVMNADGTNLVRLTNDPGEDVTPSWGFVEAGPADAPPGSAVTIPLEALNNSGQSGTVALTDRGDGTTRVVVTVGNAPPGVEQPLHIHEGSCANLNPKPVFPLQNLVNGRSESVAQVALSDLLAKPYAVVAHKSAQEAAIYVTCGNLVKPASGRPAVGTVAAGRFAPVARREQGIRPC